MDQPDYSLEISALFLVSSLPWEELQSRSPHWQHSQEQIFVDKASNDLKSLSNLALQF